MYGSPRQSSSNDGNEWSVFNLPHIPASRLPACLSLSLSLSVYQWDYWRGAKLRARARTLQCTELVLAPAHAALQHTLYCSVYTA